MGGSPGATDPMAQRNAPRPGGVWGSFAASVAAAADDAGGVSWVLSRSAPGAVYGALRPKRKRVGTTRLQRQSQIGDFTGGAHDAVCLYFDQSRTWSAAQGCKPTDRARRSQRSPLDFRI